MSQEAGWDFPIGGTGTKIEAKVTFLKEAGEERKRNRFLHFHEQGFSSSSLSTSRQGLPKSYLNEPYYLSEVPLAPTHGCTRLREHRDNLKVGYLLFVDLSTVVMPKYNKQSQLSKSLKEDLRSQDILV
ncbi:hypothetical protein TNIN_106071 [Trichonephila inaurata madagascariensis]|uniref:Uncharacterized protein n=1 Tax=Trichonephila inaurata madagascariensis TaxID=2747483 RepID=A0A8X7CRN2_9ARAC|nr:hypothetical protein TNIN_106071 [Trichonephila inaurata madagascariensis]